MDTEAIPPLDAPGVLHPNPEAAGPTRQPDADEVHLAVPTDHALSQDGVTQEERSRGAGVTQCADIEPVGAQHRTVDGRDQLNPGTVGKPFAGAQCPLLVGAEGRKRHSLHAPGCAQRLKRHGEGLAETLQRPEHPGRAVPVQANLGVRDGRITQAGSAG